MSQHYDFTVIPSDDPDVREADRGFLTEISWTVTAPEGGKSHGVRRVLITADMGATVHLGLLAQPEPVPPYTGGYALAPDLAAEVATRAAADAALDGRVDALEVAPPAHTHPLADVTDAGTAAAADVGDFATAAQGTKADTAVQPARTITAGTGLTGGGDLSADRTLTVAYGTTSTTATVGNDSRVTGAAQKSANLSDLASASTARTNLGLTDAAVVGALPIPDPGSFYPTDTITAALQLIGGREQYGTGSPEGVVTAPVGTYYTDTAITNGAMRWAKKTGTGNTGWQVTEGDTGWRDVASLLANGWTATAGALTLARRGGTVTLASNHNGLNPAAKTSSVFMFLPSGFRPLPFLSSPLNYRAIGNGFESGSETPRKIVAQSDGALTQATATSTITFSITWSTGDPWPTTLPGTAI